MVQESLNFLQSLVKKGLLDTFGFVLVSTPHFSEQPWKCFVEANQSQVVGTIVKDASTFTEAVMLLCEQVTSILSVTWSVTDDQSRSSEEIDNRLYQLQEWVAEQSIIGNGDWSISIEFLRDQDGSLVWCSQAIGYTTGEIQIDECETSLEQLCEIMHERLTNYETL